MGVLRFVSHEFGVRVDQGVEVLENGLAVLEEVLLPAVRASRAEVG